MNADTEIERLRAEVAERQAKIGKLKAHAAHQRVEDLDAFEAMTDTDRLELYRDAPDLWNHYMKLKQERSERALIDSARWAEPTEVGE